MSNPFRPKLSKNTKLSEDSIRKHYYSSWRKFNQQQKAPFIAIDNVFKDKHLNKLEPGPLRLYLYFCFAANNTNGNSWHSISTIADFFGAQTRTIDNWIKVLVDEGLIYRQKAGKKSNTTYLIPFSHTFLEYRKQKKYKYDNQDMLDDCLDDICKRKEVYGEIIKVYHFFQWSNKQDKNSHQVLFVLSQRNDVITSNMINLTKSDDMGVSEGEVEDVLRFESPFEFNGEKVMGLAFPDDNPVITSSKTSRYLLEILVELTDTETWQFEEIEEVTYDKIDTLFPEEEGETAEKETASDDDK